MAERLTLTTPESTPDTNYYELERITFDLRGFAIYIQLKGENGETRQATYNPSTVPTGQSLIIALNKANLTTRSLNQRIFDRLIADGHLSGTVTGTVDYT